MKLLDSAFAKVEESLVVDIVSLLAVEEEGDAGTLRNVKSILLEGF